LKTGEHWTDAAEASAGPLSPVHAKELSKELKERVTEHEGKNTNKKGYHAVSAISQRLE